MRFLYILIIFTLSLSTKAQDCIAHRANIDGALENSLEAIRAATQRGVSGIEFDVQFTEDGVPLVYHNSRLEEHVVGEYCPLGKKIHRLKFSQIQDYCFLENGESVPLLSEVLEILKTFDGYIFLELKKKPTSQFFSVLNDSGLSNSPKLKILSFKKRALRAVKRQIDNVQTLLLSLFVPRGLFFQNVGFNKHLKIFIPLFRRMKKGVGIWTLNKKKDILKAIKKKADFIITDEYDLCTNSL